jgi:ribosomal protein L10
MQMTSPKKLKLTFKYKKAIVFMAAQNMGSRLAANLQELLHGPTAVLLAGCPKLMERLLHVEFF